MTADLRAVEDLQRELRARAETVPTPVGLGLVAAENARRIRARRRIAGASAVVVALVILSPLVVRAVADDGSEPVEPSPVMSTLRWTETLPGVDLPMGKALSVAYAVGGTVTFGPREVEFEGAVVTQILDSATGPVVVAGAVGGPSGIWHLDGSETIRIADDLQLSGTVVQGTGYDGLPHIAYAVGGPGTPEVFAGPLLDPQPLGGDDGYVAAGFLRGEPVFGAASRPSTLTRFQTATQGSSAAAVARNVVGDRFPAFGRSALAGWWELDDGAVAFYRSVSEQCFYARPVPGLTHDNWVRCLPEDEFDDMTVGPTYGAVGVDVFELEVSGKLLRTFDLPLASPSGLSYDIEPIGWETATDVIIRIAAYEAVAERSDPRAGNYVAVRCSVDHGECQRLPHPVDVLATAVR